MKIIVLAGGLSTERDVSLASLCRDLPDTVGKRTRCISSGCISGT